MTMVMVMMILWTTITTTIQQVISSSSSGNGGILEINNINNNNYNNKYITTYDSSNSSNSSSSRNTNTPVPDNRNNVKSTVSSLSTLTSSSSALPMTSHNSQQQQQQDYINPVNDISGVDDVIFIFMRDGIVSFTFLLLLFIMSHFIIRRFIRKKDVYKKAYLPRILCTFCLSVSLAAMLLIPITIISNEILTTFPSNYYIQWLNRDLIFSFWNKIFWGANISLFIVLPFAYFYYEAEGIERSFLSRIKDALLVLSLVSVIFIACVYVVYILFFDFDQNIIKAIFSDYLPFSYSLISTSGTIFVLFCVPKGFNRLAAKGISLAIPQSKDELQAARLEILTIQENLKNRRFEDGEMKKIETKQQELERFIKNSEKMAKRPVYNKIVAVLITIINFLFSGLVVSKAFVSVVKRIFDNIAYYSWTSAASARVDNVYDFLAYSSKLGSFESLFETAVIIYLMVSAFVGFFNISVFSNIRPSIASTSLRKLIINTGIILLMSSSFPVVVRTLEICRFDLMGYYTHTNYLNNDAFKLIYCISFITALIQNYVKFLSPKSETPFQFINPTSIPSTNFIAPFHQTTSTDDLQPQQSQQNQHNQSIITTTMMVAQKRNTHQQQQTPPPPPPQQQQQQHSKTPTPSTPTGRKKRRS